MCDMLENMEWICNRDAIIPKRKQSAAAKTKVKAKPQAKPKAEEKPAAEPIALEGKNYPVPDLGAFAINLIQAASLGQKAASRLLKNEDREGLGGVASDAKRIGKIILDVATSYVKNPRTVVEAQGKLWNG